MSPWHTRSLVPVGAANVYCFSGQLAKCVEHTRSADAVGADDSHSPAVHCVTAAHAAPSLAPDHEVPAVHAAHLRSLDGVPTLTSPWPAGHRDHVAHAADDVLPADENVPPTHAVHVALTAPAYWPAAQIVHAPLPAAAA